MSRESFHPLDERKLCELGEGLLDIAAGRRLTREGLAPLVEILAFNILGTALADADAVLDRMLGDTDARIGRDAVECVIFAHLIAAEIRA